MDSQFHTHSSYKKNWANFAVRFALSLILAFFVHYLKLDYIESYFYDLRVWLRPPPPASERIELALIESSNVQEFNSKPTLEHHQKFLENLLKSDPLAVIYVMNPQDIEGTHKDKENFVKTALKFKNFFYVTLEALKGEKEILDFTDEFKPLKVFSGPVTADTFLLAKDGVTRRMFLSYQDQIMLHPYLASLIIPQRADLKKIRGSFPFYDSVQIYIDPLPTRSYSKWNFSQIYNEKYSSNRFKDKIIFVGTDLGTNPKDYVLTPYSREINAMTKVEAHANMLDTVIRNSSPIQVNPWINMIISFFIAFMTIYVVLAMSPIKGLIVLGIYFILFILLSYILFWPFGIWIDVAHPILTIFISYYFFIPYRLIMENRRSWELFEKNKLLTQVEVLKNNFISMMSHDLKTPLARIQGMADIIARDKKNTLSEEQRTAVQTIQQSSDDLLNFISSILNFSRIESQGVKLNIKSKDINTLIEEVLQKYEFLSQQKHIRIKKNLEPLFSLRMDPDLIRQVISNLVENAIKYSQPNSEVTISTEESAGHVVLKVTDQGMGIPEDEISSIFMKFFRSKNAKTSPIKGSGLGLYLAKYFVELHKGSLTVVSKVNEGSTFIVELPVNS